jgi:hypothetical protein
MVTPVIPRLGAEDVEYPCLTGRQTTLILALLVASPQNFSPNNIAADRKVAP